MCGETREQALAILRAEADPTRAAEMAAYHKAARPYLGVTVPQITDLAAAWRAELDLRTMCEDAWRWQSANPRGYAD